MIAAPWLVWNEPGNQYVPKLTNKGPRFLLSWKNVSGFSVNPSGLTVPNGGTQPPQPILFLVKFVHKEKHVKSLLRGELYAQRLSCFKRRESGTAPGLVDPHEGTSSWMQPGSVSLQINGWDLTPDLAGPVQTQPTWCNHLNVFCVHAAPTNRRSLERARSGDIEGLRRKIRIPQKCFELGKHAIVIRDIPEFMRRFDAAIASHRYKACKKLVRYYDPSTLPRALRWPRPCVQETQPVRLPTRVQVRDRHWYHR